MNANLSFVDFGSRIHEDIENVRGLELCCNLSLEYDYAVVSIYGKERLALEACGMNVRDILLMIGHYVGR